VVDILRAQDSNCPNQPQKYRLSLAALETLVLFRTALKSYAIDEVWGLVRCLSNGTPIVEYPGIVVDEDTGLFRGRNFQESDELDCVAKGARRDENR
jgi:hypothetical protein